MLAGQVLMGLACFVCMQKLVGAGIAMLLFKCAHVLCKYGRLLPAMRKPLPYGLAGTPKTRRTRNC